MENTHIITREDMRVIGQNVRRRRYDLRCSQTDMAATVGIPLRQYQRIEEGTSILRLDELMRVLHVLGASFTWYLEDRGPFTRRVRRSYRKQTVTPDSTLSGNPGFPPWD